jgi:hypothetical protein
MDERITCSVNEACRLSGLGLEEGKIQSVIVGTRRLINLESLRKLLTPLQPSARDMFEWLDKQEARQ